MQIKKIISNNPLLLRIIILSAYIRIRSLFGAIFQSFYLLIWY